MSRLRVVSHFPGRLRVRAEPFRDPAFGKEVADQIGEEQGVMEASVVNLTGSLLVIYEASKVQLPWLVQLIVRVGGLDGLETDHNGLAREAGGPMIKATLGRWNGAVMDATRGRLDARTAVPATLAGLGVLTLLFGRRRLPEWYDLVFWSFTTFMNFNMPQVPQAASQSDDGQSS